MADVQINIEVSGFDEIARRLGAAVAAETLRAPLVEAQKLIGDRLKHYPPPPPNSTYVRTERLGEEWQTPDPSGLVATISNMVQYAPLVQGSPLLGDPHQTAQHAQTGWLTDVQAIEESLPEVEAAFNEAIDGALNG
jgi:hypothetical protein